MSNTIPIIPDYRSLQSCLNAGGDSARLTKSDLQIATSRLADEVRQLTRLLREGIDIWDGNDGSNASSAWWCERSQGQLDRGQN